MLALTFQVGTDRVAIDVRRVREVVPRVQLTPSSGRPAWVAGVFVYRGRVVPVVDLHRLIGAGECPPHLSSRIIIVPFPAGSDELVGLLATQVADIRDLPVPPASTLAEPLTGLGPPMADGTAVLRILDPDRLLSAADLALVAPSPGAGP
ncbi:MAG: chemotaxis protein CheW [Gemmataceae bacterium]|nr:chemotaxis protein CheW [Gemmataceae bacterium]